jgi:hypothetical protein
MFKAPKKGKNPRKRNIAIAFINASNTATKVRIVTPIGLSILLSPYFYLCLFTFVLKIFFIRSAFLALG